MFVIQESRVCHSYLYTMQVGRWSVKNQCIWFTNFRNQSSQHPVKWRNHWKTWMISWPPTHPPPPTNSQTNNKKQKQHKSKQQQHTQHQQPQQTNKQPQQNNKSQQKRIIRTNKQKQKKSPPRSTYSTVLCFVLYVDGSPLFILWFSFCSCLFNLLLWVRQTKRGLNGEKTSNARRNKTKTNLRFRQLLSAWR